MIAKQIKGRGFRGCLNYLLEKDGAELIGGNMLGENAQELSAEFSASRKLRPNLTRAVYHSSLSLSPGEKLSDSQWGKVTESYMKQMGFEGSQYCVVRHRDRDHEHVHVVASRIRMDGSYVSESQDYQRSEGILRGLEREHGLKRVTPSRETQARAPSRYELELAQQGIPSTKLRLQSLIDQTIGEQRHPTMSGLVTQLHEKNVLVIPNVAKTGHVSGVSFVLDGELMKGSDLGRGYSWSGLQKRGVNYDHDRDRQALGQAQQRAVERGYDGITRSSRPGDSTHSPTGVSKGSGRSDHRADRAPLSGTGHDRQRELGASHPNEGTHREIPEGGRSQSPGSGAGRPGVRDKEPRAHHQALGGDAPGKPPRVSHERNLILALAAAALRRESSGIKLDRFRSTMATHPGGATEEVAPSPVWRLKAAEKLKKEIDAYEAAKALERDLEKKLRDERERQQKLKELEKSRGGLDFGIDRGFFGR